MAELLGLDGLRRDGLASTKHGSSRGRLVRIRSDGRKFHGIDRSRSLLHDSNRGDRAIQVKEAVAGRTDEGRPRTVRGGQSQIKRPHLYLSGSRAQAGPGGRGAIFQGRRTSAFKLPIESVTGFRVGPTGEHGREREHRTAISVRG